MNKYSNEDLLTDFHQEKDSAVVELLERYSMEIETFASFYVVKDKISRDISMKVFHRLFAFDTTFDSIEAIEDFLFTTARDLIVIAVGEIPWLSQKHGDITDKLSDTGLAQYRKHSRFMAASHIFLIQDALGYKSETSNGPACYQRFQKTLNKKILK